MRSVPSSAAVATGGGASATGAPAGFRGARGAAVAVSPLGASALAFVRGASGSRLTDEELADSVLAGTRPLNITYVAKPPPTAIARTTTTARIRPVTGRFYATAPFH